MISSVRKCSNHLDFSTYTDSVSGLLSIVLCTLIQSLLCSEFVELTLNTILSSTKSNFINAGNVRCALEVCIFHSHLIYHHPTLHLHLIHLLLTRASISEPKSVHTINQYITSHYESTIRLAAANHSLSLAYNCLATANYGLLPPNKNNKCLTST